MFTLPIEASEVELTRGYIAEYMMAVVHGKAEQWPEQAIHDAMHIDQLTRLYAWRSMVLNGSIAGRAALENQILDLFPVARVGF